MGDWDPLKVVALFEQIFGETWGRRIFTALFSLGILAATAWLLGIIWENGGSQLLSLISVFEIPDLTFGQSELAGVGALILTLMTLVISFGVVVIFVLLVVSRKIFRRAVPQQSIDELAIHRDKGVTIMNAPVSGDGIISRGNRKPVEISYEEWVKKWEEWRVEVIASLDAKFTKAESLSFQTLGVIQMHGVPALGVQAQHQHKIAIIVKQLSVLEGLIDRYQERI